MHKIQKELYQAPVLNKISVPKGLNLLVTFSISVHGEIENIEGGLDEEGNNHTNW